MTTDKLKINYRLKHKTCANPQIKNHKKGHELRLIRPWTKHKNPEHMHLKFLTPLPPVEKIVNLNGFKYIYKPRNTGNYCEQFQEVLYIQWSGCG
jgi:hypothetical protein